MRRSEPGEEVLDLGSGSGTDVFVAAIQVGESGRAVGIDFTDEQVGKAARLRDRDGFPQVEFAEAHIDDLPFEDESFDAVISNGVINLSPVKGRVFAEAARVLRPGGRLAIADIVSGRPLKERTRRDVELWAACIAGAIPRRSYVETIEGAGLHVARGAPERLQLHLRPGPRGVQHLRGRERLAVGRKGALAAVADRSVARPQPMSTPPTQYAKSGDASIAYQVVGDGPIDLVLVLGFATHLELQWESPAFARFFERISSFSRLIIFDKRGTGLSDPVTEVPTLEQRIDDVRAVMDAAGSERAALVGVSEGGPMSVLFAATHPERVTALVLHGAMGRTTEAPDYPWASPAEALRESAAEFIAPYWGQHAEGMVELFAPSLAGDPQAVEFTARLERSAASPAMVQQIFEMFLDIDVRAILPTIHVPTLVLHRRGDRVVNRRAGEELAAQIPAPDTWSFPGSTICPGQATLRPCSARSRSS